MVRSPWVTRAIMGRLPSKSHDPVIPVGHKEAWPDDEPLAFDPYLASLVDGSFTVCDEPRGASRCIMLAGHEGFHEGVTSGYRHIWPKEDHNA